MEKGPDSFGGVKVAYGSRIIVPTVNLAGITRFFQTATTTDAEKVIAGQGIKATLDLGSDVGLLPAESVSPQVAPGTHLWSELTERWNVFKRWESLPTLGRKVDLTASDRTKAAYDFFANGQGDDQVVCDFRIVAGPGSRFEGDLPAFQAKSRKCEVVRPKFSADEISTGSVVMLRDSFIFDSADRTTQGQGWHKVALVIPGGFDQAGRGAFCQLINATRVISAKIRGSSVLVDFIKARSNGLPTQSVSCLDDRFPYRFATNGGIWDLPGTGSGGDSPKQPFTWNVLPANFEYWYESRAADQFRTWVMFQPPEKAGNSVSWIPIASYIWSWSGVARFDPVTQVWSLLAADGGPRKEWTEEFEFPSWDRVSPSPFGFEQVP